MSKKHNGCVVNTHGKNGAGESSAQGSGVSTTHGKAKPRNSVIKPKKNSLKYMLYQDRYELGKALEKAERMFGIISSVDGIEDGSTRNSHNDSSCSSSNDSSSSSNQPNSSTSSEQGSNTTSKHAHRRKFSGAECVHNKKALIYIADARKCVEKAIREIQKSDNVAKVIKKRKEQEKTDRLYDDERDSIFQIQDGVSLVKDGASLEKDCACLVQGTALANSKRRIECKTTI